jgi:hypothetical protein
MLIVSLLLRKHILASDSENTIDWFVRRPIFGVPSVAEPSHDGFVPGLFELERF